ncbi:MAG: RNA-binding protein S4 [Desulfotomaculum sp. BICA1-6]|nr:MAG: RNA-binding protein S4 [Desulfotomaculum sp. BICA1-6]
MNREKLLNLAATPEEREVTARVLDLAETVLKTRRPRTTDFYDPYRCRMVARVIEAIPDLAARVDGGNPVAERSRVFICPDFLAAKELDTELVFLEIKGNFRYAGASHRDYLGAILGLGLQRDKLGDIWVSENGAQVVAAREIAGYITAGLTSVGRVSVTVREISREELKPPEPETKDISTTVQSMRLDAVAAHGFGLSRSKMVREINAGKVYLNWRPCLDPSAQVNSGDMLSARGRGRVEVAEAGGRTKKNRIALLLKKFK